MDVLIFDNTKQQFVEAEIVKAEYSNLPLKKDGWQFNWKTAYKKDDSEVYLLREKNASNSIQGFVQLIWVEEMLVMNLLEIAPRNLGRKEKRFEFVAGCLIAYACNKSFTLQTNYRGFLIFETKTKLRAWYTEKYYAQTAMHNRMFIEPIDSIKLIKEYLERKKEQ